MVYFAGNDNDSHLTTNGQTLKPFKESSAGPISPIISTWLGIMPSSSLASLRAASMKVLSVYKMI